MRKPIISILIVLGILTIILFGNYAMGSEKDNNVFAQRNPAPDFTLMDINNNTFTLSEHMGEVVLINLMSPPSATSNLVMEELNNVHEQVGTDIIIISIDVLLDDTKEDIEEAFGEYVEKWIFALDTEEERVLVRYDALIIPMIVIVDTLGDISFTNFGIIEEETLLEEIDKADREIVVQDFLIWMGISGLILALAIVAIVVIIFYKKQNR
jgi:DNA mismatch repair ATPase MutL